MKIKNYFIICIGILFVVFTTFLVSAGCCEKTKDGFWCQDVTEDQCETNFLSTTSCAQTTFCTSAGTCVDSAKGTCKENSYKIECTSGGGTWEKKDKNEIAMCREGCCIIGESADLRTSVECQQLASDYGIDIDFRANIEDLGACSDLAYTKEKGACVYEKNYATTCEFITKEDCNSKKSVSLTDEGGIRGLIGGGKTETIEEAIFHSGLLCTAPGLSDCAVSSETICYNDQVYFIDTCGQNANVYDSRMYTENENQWTKEMRDYWTYVKEPSCTVSGLDASCGNCNFWDGGNTCGAYKKGAQGMPTQRPLGDYVCKDLACYYDVNDDGKEERYEHGESVCAESEGTFFHIPQVKERSEILREELADITQYNLPGSRYYKLQCWNGVMKTIPCREYRNEVCEEMDLADELDLEEEYMQASCVVNDWRNCFEITNVDDCENDKVDCKWIPGYRFDNQNFKERDKEDEQGSCVPLYTPGFDFWEPESDAHALCSLNSLVIENVIYEQHFLGNRNDFGGVSTEDAAQRCFENCYAIPDYGVEFTASFLEDFHLNNGKTLPSGGIRDYHLSGREGYYCLKDRDEPDTIDNLKVGLEAGNEIQCAAGDNKDSDRRRVKLFYTYDQWLNSVKQRAKSMGDCGVKENAVGTSGQDGAELITVIFQKLKQDGSVKENGTVETIWIGDKRIDGYRNVDGGLEEELDNIEPSWEYHKLE